MGKQIKAIELVSDVAENICDNFCKYRETCDDNFECEYIRKYNKCPFDELYKEANKWVYQY